MSSSTSELFERARSALDREVRRLEVLGQVKAPERAFDQDGFDAIGRALSYVVMGGVLEELMRELPAALASDIVGMRLERRRLPISLIAAIEAATFRQCGTDNVASLVARADLVRSVASHLNDPRPVPHFGDVFNLADGTTVGEKHFLALWSILGLDGDWKNHPNDRLLLREIKEKRNDVAHWNEDPVEIGRKKRPSDLIAMVERLISLLDHSNLHIMYWFEDRGDPAAVTDG